MNPNNQLVIQGKEIAIPTFGGAVSDKGSLIGVRRFVANAFGLSETDIEGKTFKEVKTLAKANGATDEKLKTLSTEYDSHRTSFYKEGAVVNGMLAADPAFRKTLRVNRSKDGKVIGATTTYRRERSPSASKDATILALQAELARMKALLPASA